MAQKYLIKNATLVNEGLVREGDLLVADGRIIRVGGDIPADAHTTVHDASGLHILPGMIDDQVHFREPGLTHKGDIGSESRAAVAGGITSFMEMPNTSPPTLTHEALEAKYAIAGRTSFANYAFYLGASNDNLDAVRTLDPRAAAGVKVFMGSSTGNMLVDNEETLAGIFRDSPVIITTHCESTPRIQQNLQKAIEKYGRNIPLSEHPNIRDAECCYQSSSLAVELARRHGAQLHILHLTTAREMELFEPGPINGKSITAEVCAHHLYFSSEDYATRGNAIKCNPAVKSPADRAALRRALLEGRLDIIATDHAPHTREEKANPDYLAAPAGLPLVQDALLSVFELYHDGVLGLAEIVEKTAHNPAIRFNVRDRGYLREGYYADLVLLDLAGATEVTAGRVLSRCGWSPFDGVKFRTRISSTFVNGQLAFDGENVFDHRAAMRLEFDRPAKRN
jgi:dihydroorotase